jgi:hypothetical protein
MRKRIGVIGIVHSVGTAGFIAQPDRARAAEHDDLVALLSDFGRRQRGGGRRHVDDGLDALVVEHVAGDIGGEISLVEMIRRDDLDLAAKHLAAKILHGHLRRCFAAGTGDVSVKSRHVENGAELERRFGLCRCRRYRDRQNGRNDA